MGGVLVFGLTIGALAVARSDAPSAQPARVAPQPSAISSEPDAARVEAETKIDEAARVWYAYMKLPAEKQTIETWNHALIESTAKGDGLRPPYDDLFRRENFGLSRKYGAPLINLESRATGDGFTVLIPSQDQTKCVVWASQWLQSAASLRAIGFTRLRCEGAATASKVTGNPIKEPDQEWVVP